MARKGVFQIRLNKDVAIYRHSYTHKMYAFWALHLTVKACSMPYFEEHILRMFLWLHTIFIGAFCEKNCIFVDDYV